MRALRRHHRGRITRKWSKIARIWDVGLRWQTPEEYRKWARKYSGHLCSCFMCGNRRKYEGLSLCERKAHVDYIEQLEVV